MPALKSWITLGLVTMHRVWISFCSSLELSVSPPVSALAVIRTNHVFSTSECPERQQVDALWSWWPANLVTLSQATNLCITSPYTTPIPLLVILSLPNDRTNTAATGRKIGRRTFFPLSPKDQFWLGFMGFMVCPCSSWQGCGELGVSSGPWQSCPDGHFWAVSQPLNKEQHWAFLRWLRPISTQALLAAAPHCTTPSARVRPCRCSQLAAEVKPLHTRGESAGRGYLVSEALKGFQRRLWCYIYVT